MKEEGFINGALNIIKEKNISARYLAGQSSFNFPDNSKIDSKTKASVIFSMMVYNNEALPNQLDEHILRALDVESIGEIKSIMQEVEYLLSTVTKECSFVDDSN